MAKKDPTLFVVTPAMPAGSCLQEFMRVFPERCLDVGIAEGHAVTFCGGVGYGKKTKVVCSIYSTFLQRAFDNLFHDVCLQQIPIVFAIDRAGISGPDGSTHHGIYDIAFLNAMPNMVICQPRNAQLLKELLENAFSWNLPTAIRYPNMVTEEPESALASRPLGIGEILVTGSKLVIIAVGHMCYTAIKVRELLLPYGIEATIVDPVFLKPLDQELFCTILTQHNFVVTLEEHSLNGGFASILNQFIIRNKFYHVQVLNLGIPEAFIEQGNYKDLIQAIGLSPKAIAEQIKLEFFSFSEQLKPSSL
jgi:1-deoxy-D-xylulose-5-phosphate synthase